MPDTPAPAPDNPHLAKAIASATATRHDGWTGECMAIFCETLAETAVVVDACQAARKSTNTAYELRRRNPWFAAAWDASLIIARHRLADTLLARSIEGNIELIWRDGQVVGERHVLDNRLGLAILKRLDKLAEKHELSQFPCGGRGPVPANKTPAPRSQPFDWEMMVSALRSGEPDQVAAALALVAPETHETHDPPFSSEAEDDDEGLDLSHRCWLDRENGEAKWMTSFPPPADFTGFENCDYGGSDTEYERECTPDEVAALEGDAARARDAERAEDEALRDAYFSMLREELVEAVDEPVDGLGDPLVEPEGDLAEDPADRVAP